MESPSICTVYCLCILIYVFYFSFFFFNDTATTEIYTLSLHDALPILSGISNVPWKTTLVQSPHLLEVFFTADSQDRKSTRLNSSHVEISYAVFCLKKKKKTIIATLSIEHIPTHRSIPILHLP